MYAQTTTIDKGLEYYKKKYIQYLLLEGVKDRELSALGSDNANARAFNTKCLFDLNRVLKLINWNKNRQKLYRSVARLKNIPEFTFNPKTRSSETNPWFRKEYSNHMISYDLFFDFDKPKEDTWINITEEVKDFKSYLDEYQVPYTIFFSGNKGFQILISGEYVDIKKIEKGNVYPHKKIVEDIKEKLGLNYLDLSLNGVNSKLCKLPYSLAGENIVLPLNNDHIENFKIEDMKIENVFLKVKPIIRRGLLERFTFLSLNQRRRNVENFIKLFTFK